MEDFVINGPKSVEVQTIFIKLNSFFHTKVRLISDDVVNFLEFYWVKHIVDFFFVVMLNESRQEQTIIIFPFNERMSGISVCFDR